MKPENYPKKTLPRSFIMQFKVDSKEKATIENRVLQFGGTTSEYLRTKALQTENSTSGKEKQLLARLLCQHAQLVNKIHDPDLRNRFIGMEKKLWLLTR